MYDEMFLITPDNKAVWLLAPSCMSYQLQKVRAIMIALLTLGLADFLKLGSISATGDRKYWQSILFTG